MKIVRVKNKEISITVEKAQKAEKFVVWGCFYGKGGKDFKRYFETVEKAMFYYNNQLNKAVEMYLSKCELILNN